MISGKYIDEYGRDLIYRLIATLEEAFEMFGAWLFIYSLMKYLTRQAGSFELKVELTNRATVPVSGSNRNGGTSCSGGSPSCAALDCVALFAATAPASVLPQTDLRQ